MLPNHEAAGRSAEVEAWLAAYDNPQKDLLLAVRDVVLDADPRVGECIKWKSPTFTYRGNIASFNPRSKRHVSLMFHTGAQIPGAAEVLHGSGATAGYMTFTDREDLERQRAGLIRVVRSWIAWKDGDG